MENAAFSTLKCFEGDAARNGYAEGKQTAREKKKAFSAASGEIRNNTVSVIAECYTEAFEPSDAFDLRKRRKKGGGEKKNTHMPTCLSGAAGCKLTTF